MLAYTTTGTPSYLVSSTANCGLARTELFDDLARPFPRMLTEVLATHNANTLKPRDAKLRRTSVIMKVSHLRMLNEKLSL